MKFKCIFKETYHEWRDRKDHLTKWHKWFAWYPVKIGKYCYWLEFVERKARLYCDIKGIMFWSIREVKINDPDEKVTCL